MPIEQRRCVRVSIVPDGASVPEAEPAPLRMDFVRVHPNDGTPVENVMREGEGRVAIRYVFQQPALHILRLVSEVGYLNILVALDTGD